LNGCGLADGSFPASGAGTGRERGPAIILKRLTGPRPGVHAVVGNGVYAAGQLAVMLLIPALTGIRDLGVYALALAIAAPVQLGLSMNMRSVRVIEPNERFSTRDFLTLSAATGALAICVSTAIGTAFLHDFDGVLVVFLVALTKGLESMLEITYGDLQREGRLDLVAESQILRSVLNMVAVAGCLWAFRTLLAAVAGMAVVAVVALTVAWMIRRGRIVSAPARLVRVRMLLALIWPLGISAGVTSLNGSLPRLVCFPLLGVEAAGYLALLTYPATVLSLLGNSLGQANLVRFREARSSGDRRSLWRAAKSPLAVVTLIGLVTAIGVALVVVLVPLGQLLPDDYSMVAPAFIVSATVAASCAIAFHVQTSSGVYKFHPFLSAATGLVALVLLVPLTKAFAVAGVATAMILYYSFQFVAWISVALYGASRPQNMD
jgi:O-antigen/teichoic acid export membrane protein